MVDVRTYIVIHECLLVLGRNVCVSEFIFSFDFIPDFLPFYLKSSHEPVPCTCTFEKIALAFVDSTI